MSSTKEPIVFNSPGLKPDTRLKVFNQEFQVHSAILKLYSAFFRKFLDSPDKTPAEPSALFQYDYVSVIDDDGTWGLEAASKVKSATTTKYLKNGQTEVRETTAFGNILHALYSKPYYIDSVQELGDLSRLASFYCALRMVSASLYGVLHTSPGLLHQLQVNCVDVLIYARQLRQPLLFREALVHVVSSWADHEIPNKQMLRVHPELFNIIDAAYNKLCKMILKALSNVVACVPYDTVVANLVSNCNSKLIVGDPTVSVCFYRALHTDWPITDQAPASFVRGDLHQILEKNLALDTCSDQPGFGKYTYKFLCASIEDKELPWDLSAEDW